MARREQEIWGYGGRGASRGVTGKPEICQELLAASHPIDEIPEKCPFRREGDSQSLLLSGFEQTARGRSQRGRADYCAWGVGLARGDPDDVGRRLSEEPAERRRHIIGANNLQSLGPDTGGDLGQGELVAPPGVLVRETFPDERQQASRPAKEV